ncbi:hypothetical protein [Haliea atlantica]|jgi:PHD/YefM family antitoxin component YafN of YafNO toxin-antitoxin module|nr:hypothetical protein [Haliea sp.]|tara:strand:+ start:59441 stop:59893 length:453 start_codon:yes stop_codon:yes gene_type:complete
MSSEAVKVAGNSPEEQKAFRRQREVVKELDWLEPAALLRTKGGSEFGRQIEDAIDEMNRDTGVVRLKLRKRDAAVVLTISHYEELLKLKQEYNELLMQVKEQAISRASDEYDALYQRITSQASRRASDALFSADSEDLRQSYKPGRTENA